MRRCLWRGGGGGSPGALGEELAFPSRPDQKEHQPRIYERVVGPILLEIIIRGINHFCSGQPLEKRVRKRLTRLQQLTA